ncbi:BLUF domain-containing protein [Hymenobacter convexus]|uniref:BLUF domain-containing protein n=1 Tax=Hymenobacter sp. CA1UV-4 TaxID=3063782 RepID=UPI0027140C33|nr:BLUF domain-containing protein [Hymenobacter sp. CA1UV-4]MDO7853387.1 BLUF domain-containing protein [Hymenobacter sp. CA1UV-4]
MGLYQLLYQSQSLVPFAPAELSALLKQARTFNRGHHITGLLLYTPDGRFFQLLEGEYEEVRNLYYNHIALDPRHFNCQIQGEGPCQARTFADWSMGFRATTAADLRRLLGHVLPDSPALLIPRPHTRPELLELLLELVAQGETEGWPESQA